MRRSSALGFAILVSALAACASVDVPASGSDAPEVIGGRATDAFPGVGYLAVGPDVASLRGPNCGATLIRKNVVVTAAHCIELSGASAFGIGFGKAGSSPLLPARKVFVHPDYRFSADSPERHRHDVAVLVLDADASVAPVGRGRAATPDEELRYVGYGRTTPGDADVANPESGERKTAKMRVVGNDGLTTTVEGIDGGLCWGDSGGPLLRGNAVVGVLADFADGRFQCDVGNRMLFTSLTGEAAFLDAALECAAGGTCTLREHSAVRFPDGMCAFDCAAYGYTEGMCWKGWRCESRCLLEDASCSP